MKTLENWKRRRRFYDLLIAAGVFLFTCTCLGVQFAVIAPGTGGKAGTLYLSVMAGCSVYCYLSKIRSEDYRRMKEALVRRVKEGRL